MSKTKFMRSGKSITRLAYAVVEKDASGNEKAVVVPAETKKYGSVNAAKRESHKLQLAEDGALGLGSLMVSA